jgi:molecular chaperone HscB
MVNYFELYQLPLSFRPDKDAVKKKFYELSRLYHPDRFAQAADAERAEALRMAALNNDAYKTFNSTDATMAYILKLYNMLEDEEKYSLPPDFLMEMMDLNEAVSDYEMQPGDKQMQEQVQNMIAAQFADWDTSIKPLTEDFGHDLAKTETLVKIKDFYFRKKYLLRIQQRINTFAAQ